MNPQHLESLVLDRELGELPPEVATLLEAYLALDPAAARRAGELRTTVALTRRAVVTPASAPAIPLDVDRLRRALPPATATAAPTPAASARRTEFYRLAACLALGLGLGWLARPTSAPPGLALEPAAPIRIVSPAPAEPRSTFWSLARLAATTPTTRAAEGTRLPLR